MYRILAAVMALAALAMMTGCANPSAITPAGATGAAVATAVASSSASPSPSGPLVVRQTSTVTVPGVLVRLDPVAASDEPHLSAATVFAMWCGASSSGCPGATFTDLRLARIYDLRSDEGSPDMYPSHDQLVWIIEWTADCVGDGPGPRPGTTPIAIPTMTCESHEVVNADTGATSGSWSDGPSNAY